ncbi:MAG: DNA-formamidopyrimidine glycosylase family protein, partial [Terriglobales bacterium]
MPELPEVETIARGLDKRVAGDAIESVWIGSKPQPLKSPAAEIVSTLEGRRVVRVHRAGKHIVFDLEGAVARERGKARSVRRKTRQAASLPRAHGAEKAQWIVHLGMTGSMV